MMSLAVLLLGAAQTMRASDSALEPGKAALKTKQTSRFSLLQLQTRRIVHWL
jgi:hypothetical protein